MPELSRIEDRVIEIIGERFGVDLQHHPVTKQADLIALATEKRDLMPYSTEPWRSLTGVEPVEEKLMPLQPEQAKRVFLDVFAQLFGSSR
ncbi:MAG: hypothetical protein Q8O38_07080 [Sulfurimicrobium sp.]|nr:hypothetical protein [Sulfurimicrobium sp.]